MFVYNNISLTHCEELSSTYNNGPKVLLNATNSCFNDGYREIFSKQKYFVFVSRLFLAFEITRHNLI